jgi:hypothetical protein
MFGTSLAVVRRLTWRLVLQQSVDLLDLAALEILSDDQTHNGNDHHCAHCAQDDEQSIAAFLVTPVVLAVESEAFVAREAHLF